MGCGLWTVDRGEGRTDGREGKKGKRKKEKKTFNGSPSLSGCFQAAESFFSPFPLLFEPNATSRVNAKDKLNQWWPPDRRVDGRIWKQPRVPSNQKVTMWIGQRGGKKGPPRVWQGAWVASGCGAIYKLGFDRTVIMAIRFSQVL